MHRMATFSIYDPVPGSPDDTAPIGFGSPNHFLSQRRGIAGPRRTQTRAVRICILVSAFLTVPIR